MTDSARATSKIALVLADVDGTLLTSEKVLTSQAAMAVKYLQTAGIAFAITRGRPPRGMLCEPRSPASTAASLSDQTSP
jgi:hypothetical protein